MTQQVSVHICIGLVTTVFYLYCASEVLSQATVNGLHCPFNPESYNSSSHLIPVKNCDVTIKFGKIHVKCNIYASSALELPMFTNTTAGILVTDFMESYQDVEDILKQPHNSSCLRFISSRVQKLNFEDKELAKKYFRCSCTIPKEMFIPLVLTQSLDLHIWLTSDYANAVLNYNKTCLRRSVDVHNRTDSKDSVDINACISSTDFVARFRASGQHFQVAANITMEDLFTKDFLNIILMLMDEILFPGYAFRISSISFLTGLCKYLPTEALTLLSRKNVSNVELRRNGILSIRNGDLPPMETLRSLDLSDCQLESIEENAFDGTIYLNRLNLRGNKLKEMSSAFMVLHDIRELSLGGNGFNDFKYSSEIMSNAFNLKKLDLSNMILLHFWEELANLSALEQLNLSNCSLKSIPIASLSLVMPNLIHLNVSNNYLTDVNISVLSGLTKLQQLDLSSNWITHIPYNAIIESLSELKFISLKGNKILDFLPIVINNNSALRIFDLSFNRIIGWNETKVNSIERTLNVSLVGNNITEVNSQMTRDFDSLKSIQLVENPFDCQSCSLRSFLEWLSLANTSSDFPHTPYTCFFPKEEFRKIITDVPLYLCLEVFLDWVTKILTPLVVIVVPLTSISVAVFVYRWQVLYFVYLFRSKFNKYKHEDGVCFFKYDAFVSYCTADRNWVVEHLIPAMENQDPKLHLCVHERDFEIGETIMNNVIECIDNSHKSIFVLSRHFIRSQWCHWELQMAQHKLFEDKRDVLILVMLGEICEKETPKMLKHLTLKRTYLQWPSNENGYRLFWKRLKNAIGNCQCAASNTSLLNV